MRISAATGMYQRRGDSPVHRALDEVITVLHEVGYDCFDLSFSSIDQPNFILSGDDWQEKVEALGNTAAKLGVTFPQSHLPFVPGCCVSHWEAFRSEEFRQSFFGVNIESIFINGRAKCKGNRDVIYINNAA